MKKGYGLWHRLWVILGLVVLVCALIGLSGCGASDAADETADVSVTAENAGTDAAVDTESATDTESTTDTELETEAESETSTDVETQMEASSEDSVSAPELSSEVVLNHVDSTVYDERLTDLENYGRYELFTRDDFIIAYPLYLYTSLDYNTDQSTYDFVFRGTDGSVLEYTIRGYWNKYYIDEWMETNMNAYTEGMTEVTPISYEERDKAGRFFVSAKESGMQVYVVGKYDFTNSQGFFMILKYPEPVSDEDRLIKSYYLESLFCMIGFSESEEQGYTLRSYESFLEAQ